MAEVEDMRLIGYGLSGNAGSCLLDEDVTEAEARQAAKVLRATPYTVLVDRDGRWHWVQMAGVEA